MFKKVLLSIVMLIMLCSVTYATVDVTEINFNVVTSGTFDQALRRWITTLNTDIAAVAGTETGIGSKFYVDSNAAAGGAGTSWSTAVDTLQEGIDLCTANEGDIVYVAQGHAEDINNASALDADVAGISIIGIGNGEDMPTISFIDDATAEMTISDASVLIYNIRFLGARSGGITAGIVITADGDSALILGCEFRETSSSMEQLIMISVTAAADDLVIVGNSFISSTGDDTSAIVLAGASNRTIIANNNFYGEWTDYVIKASGATSVEMLIKNNVINNLDTTAGKLMAFETSSTGSVVNNKCYGNGATFAFVGAAMFLSPDNVFMNTEVVTRTFEQMLGPFTGATGGAVSTTIHADMVLAQADLDAILADFVDYQLDTLAGVSTTVNADGNLEAHVVDKSVFSHIMTTGADTSNYLASTMSLQALNVDLDTIIVDTGTDIPATLAGINTAIASIDATGFAAACTSNPANTSKATSTTLAGFGDDYFNTDWSLKCMLDISGPGSAPEGEVIDIIDYDSGTGEFTVNFAFSQQLTTGDGIWVFRTDELNLDDAVILGSSATIRYVSSITGAIGDGSGLTMENAYATIALAEAACADGDVVYIGAGHDEEIGDVVINQASNISFIGLGEGDARPLLTCNDNTDEITIDEAGITIKNIRLEAGADQVVTAFRVEDAALGCTLENISFIKGQGANEEFVICIDVDAAAFQLIIKDCTYNNTAATTTHASTFIDLTDGTIDGTTIIGCNVFGEFANGCIYSNQVLTNLSIIDNVLSNTTTAKLAVQLTGAATGVLINNRLYSDSYGTMLDPGSLKCIGNLGTDAIDQQGIAMPLSAETTDITAVDNGSNLERLEYIKDKSNDIIAALGIDSVTANIFYVDSILNASGGGLSWADATDTLAEAITAATSNTGAFIFIAPDHAEATITSSISINVADMSIIGLGSGSSRPTFTLSGQNGDFAHTVADVTWKNILFVSGTADTDECMILNGSSDGTTFIDCEWNSTGAFEFVSTITIASGCDDVRFTRCKFNNATSGVGTATAAITNIAGVTDGMKIEDCEFYGAWLEAAIWSDDADTDVMVRDNTVQNTSAGIHAIEFEAAALGSLLDNFCYADTYGTVIDPGSLKPYGNRVTSAIDQSGSVFPAIPQQIDSIHGTGQVFYVDSSGSDGDGRTWATAKITLDKGVGLCTSNRGDFIYVAQGHAEAMGAGTGATLDIAGISIIGLGNGDNRPIINFDNGASTIVTTNAGDNVLIENIKFFATVDSVLIGINIVDGTDNVTFRNCVFEAETDGTDEFDESILIGNNCHFTTIEGCTFDMANGEAVAAISSDDDTDHAMIKNCLIIGDYSTACVEFSTQASVSDRLLLGLSGALMDGVMTDFKRAG